MKWLKRIGWIILFILLGWLIFAQFGLKLRVPDATAKKRFSEKGVVLTTAFHKVNGFDLHYARTGADTLPTLLFIHGSAGSWSKFDRYLRDTDLLKKFRMVSVDRPGFGYSHFGKARKLADQSAMISDLVKALQNGKPVFAIGRSYGGTLAAKLAIDNPGMFTGLVLIAAALDPAAEKPEKWRPVMYRTPLRYMMPGAWRISNEELWHLKTELKEMAAGLKNIEARVCIIHGDNDGLVPVSNVEFAKKMLSKASEVSITIIPGANHFVSDHHYELVKNSLLELY
jgi:pimeloyl-ACP methyl ester carboxylesterase